MWDRSVTGEEPLRVFKFFPAFNLYLKRYKHPASRKKNWTEAVIANSRQEMILKATGKPLGTAKRI